jgi:hypothetical protein
MGGFSALLPLNSICQFPIFLHSELLSPYPILPLEPSNPRTLSLSLPLEPSQDIFLTQVQHLSSKKYLSSQLMPIK